MMRISERTWSAVFWTALLGASILPTTLLSMYFFNRAIPWGDDGGNWLKHTNAILGETYPMWQEGTYHYPPLFFIMVAAIYRVLGDSLLSIKIAFLVAYALRPITTYPLGKKLFGSRLSGLACAWLTSIPPIFVEMVGWGVYPNLLSMAILPLFIYFTLEYMDRTSLKNLTLTLASAVAVIVTHYLTSLIMFGILVLWAIVLLFFRQKRDFRVLLPIVASIVSFLLYRLFLAWPTQFIFHNEAAFYSLRLDPEMVLWIFKSRTLLILLYVIVVLSIVTLHERRDLRVVSLLISWLLVPIIGSQCYLLGVAMDYPRIFLFIAQPILILAAAPITFYDEALHSITAQSILKKLKNLPKHIQSYARGALDPRGAQALKPLFLIALILLSGVTSLMNLALGINWVAVADSWYTSNERNPYGDQEKLDAIRWLKANTPPDAVIVAEESMGRWVEGLAERRVLMHIHPRFLFMQGELAREYAARSILESNNGIRNGYFWIQDQAPYGEFAPLVSFYIKGVYENLIYLNENASKISWRCKALAKNTTDTCTEVLSNATQTDVQWIYKDSGMVTLSARYLLSTAIVERRVIAYKQKPYLDLAFKAQPFSDNIELSSLAISVGHVSERSLYRISVISSDTIKLITDIGVIYFETNCKTAFPFSFASKDGGKTIEGWIRIWMDVNPEYSNGLETYNIMDVIESQRVSFIILPRRSEREFNENITLAQLTNPLYQHLLNNNKFYVAYENEKVIILESIPTD